MILSSSLAKFSSTLSPVKVIGFILARDKIKDTKLTNREEGELTTTSMLPRHAAKACC